MREALGRAAQAEQSSWLIGIAQIFVGLVAVVGIVTFVTFDPYLLVVIAFAQIPLVAGIVLFAIAAVRLQRRSALQRTLPIASDISVAAKLKQRARLFRATSNVTAIDR
jgi:hypothetical protein